MEILHQDDGRHGRFFINDGGITIAEMTYRWHDSHVDIDHTEVDERLKGQSIGSKLVASAVNWAREQKVRLSASCPFANAVLQRKPEYGDVLFR